MTNAERYADELSQRLPESEVVVELAGEIRHGEVHHVTVDGIAVDTGWCVDSIGEEAFYDAIVAMVATR